MTEFTDDTARRCHIGQDAFAYVADGMGEGGACFPIGSENGVVIEGERGGAGEAGEVEFGGGEDTGLDGGFIGADFGFGTVKVTLTWTGPDTPAPSVNSRMDSSAFQTTDSRQGLTFLLDSIMTPRPTWRLLPCGAGEP